MKLKDGFITHETDGEQIMVSAGNVKETLNKSTVEKANR